MVNWVGAILTLLGIGLIIAGIIFLVTYGQSPQNPVQWWMWGLLILGILLLLIGLPVLYFYW